MHLFDLYSAGKESFLIFSEELRSVEGDAGVEAGVPGVEVVLALDAEKEHDGSGHVVGVEGEDLYFLLPAEGCPGEEGQGRYYGLQLGEFGQE